MNITKLERERKELIKRINNGLNRVNKTVGEAVDNIQKVNGNLYLPLSKIEQQQLLDADGDELKWKASRANSSACLLLNVFSSLRKGKELIIKEIGKFKSYELEKKLQVLNGRGKKANIDMMLANDQSIVYIESKFTELFYYNKKSSLSKSYFREDKYPTKAIYNASKQLFNQFNHYDSNQLIKHAIGIYRDCMNNPTLYQGKKVYLLNLNWELHNHTYKFEDSYHLQILTIKEAAEFSSLFNKLMKKVFKEIGVDFKFIYINYYDFVHHHTNIKELDLELIKYLNKRYFFYHQRKIYIDDRIEYYSSHIDNNLSLEDFDDYLKRFNIIAIENIYRADEINYSKEWMEISDAVAVIGPYLEKKFPKGIIDCTTNEFLHICSPLYFNKYTIFYFSKQLPRIKFETHI